MATPMKSVFSLVKTLSPRAPKLLVNSATPKDKRYFPPGKNLRCEDASNIWNLRIQKSLKTSPKNLRRIHLDTEYDENFLTTPSQIKTEQNVGNLFINTPVKKYLIKNGLSRKQITGDILGKGTFGTVVKGIYKDTSVAVKIIKSKDYSSNLSDFNALKLSHPNIVNIFEMNMTPEENYGVIIMEYMEGARELQTILETNDELDGKTKQKLIGDICSGLQCCHDHGILHLDIKPKNIMVLRNNVCKICDFGNSCSTKNTEDYTFQGTVAYAAPELLKGKIPTPQCDIYSVGITIWQIEYKENPYAEWSTNEALIYNVVKHNARPKHQHNNDMITKLFQRCWHKDSDCRPKISEILKMLKEIT